jgi:hypothetical protein
MTKDFASLGHWLQAIRSPSAEQRKAALELLNRKLAGDLGRRPPPPVRLAGTPTSRSQSASHSARTSVPPNGASGSQSLKQAQPSRLRARCSRDRCVDDAIGANSSTMQRVARNALQSGVCCSPPGFDRPNLAPISHVSSFSHHRGGIGALSGPGRVGAGAQKVVRSFPLARAHR